MADTILLIMLAGFVFYGLFFGLIRTTGALAGTVLGALFAISYYPVIFDWVRILFRQYENIGKFIVFLVLFAIVNRLTGFIFNMLHRVFEVISVIPFLKTINRLGGAVVGFATGTLAIGLVLVLAGVFFPDWYARLLADGGVAVYFDRGAKVIMLFLPWVGEQVKNWVYSFGFSR